MKLYVVYSHKPAADHPTKSYIAAETIGKAVDAAPQGEEVFGVEKLTEDLRIASDGAPVSAHKGGFH